MSRRANVLFWLIVGLVLCLLGASTGCGADSYQGNQDDRGEPDESLAASEQALSGSCTVQGACQFEIKLPVRLSPSDLILAASSSLKVNDRVGLQEAGRAASSKPPRATPTYCSSTLARQR
jgi:hypothetical protein